MNTSSSLRAISCAFPFLAILSFVEACAAKKESNPVPVTLDVEFPSTQAAVYIDTIKIYAFDSSQSCADLIAAEVAGQALPAVVTPIPEQSPCTLAEGPTVDLALGGNYTMFAVGQHQGVDKLIGCTPEQSFGTQEAAIITLSSIDNTVSFPTTTCFKLSDFCSAQGC